MSKPDAISGLNAITRRAAQTSLLVMLLCVSAACDRSAALDTPEGEAFCGRVTLGSAYRDGFSPRVQMRMQFDSGRLASGESPGTLTTFDNAVEDNARLLDEAPLRPIRPLEHDPLSELQLGQGRDLNYMFAISPGDPSHESLLSIISLRNDDQVEVRLIRAGVPTIEDEQPDPARQPLFGMFLLRRRTDDCGF